MTTDQELRDLLSTEAGGTTRPPAAWDDIVRRGHHRRRVTRLRNGVGMGGLAAAIAIGGFALADRGPDGKGVVANDPDPTSTTTSAVESTTTVDALYGQGISAARAQGVFVTVITAPSDPSTGFDPCTARHPRVAETATTVTIELVDASFSSGQQWRTCQSSPFSGWGTIQLTDPLDDRTLVDATTNGEIPVVDGAQMLFPTSVPAPFDVERWDEFAADTVGVEENRPLSGGWTFSFPAGSFVLTVTSGYHSRLPVDCPVRSVTVRGARGTICGSDDAPGEWALLWTEVGVPYEISVGSVDTLGEPSPFTQADVLAVAESLEPLVG
jgi:hypothetical protein